MTKTINTLNDLVLSINKNNIFIKSPDENDITYGELNKYIGDTYKKLSYLKLNKEDRVAIVLGNGSAMACTFIAIAANFTSCPLNPSYTKEEFKFYYDDLKCKAVIIEENTSINAREAAKELNIKIINLKKQTISSSIILDIKIDENNEIEYLQESKKEDVSMILHTSGTTSRPKMVPLSQKNLITSAKNISNTLNLNKNDKCLNIMPMFHIHGLIAAILAPIYQSGTIIAPPGFDALKFFRWLDEFKPTWYTAVPTMHQAILSRAPRNIDIIRNNQLKFIRSSSASLPATVMKNLENTFNTYVIESYGMTEATHQMTSNPLPPQKRKAGSVGIAAGPEVALLSKDKILNNIKDNRNITGQIIIKGENVTNGYINNPKANEESYINGWFLTGDEGIFDEDGYLKITGRLKEIINRGGEKISPKEIDEILIEHENIQQAVAFSVPHEKLGEDLYAAVILKENMKVSEEDLKIYCKKRLTQFKIPRKILIVDEIPKGATGKLQRIGLYEKLGIK
jgi:oxalate---CoA ligase